MSAGSPKNLRGALLLELEQAALDGADAGGADVAVLGGELRGVLAEEAEHLAQVFEIEEEEAVFVGDAEEDVEHAFLRFIEAEDAGEEERAELGDGGADGMAAVAEDVPEGDGVAGEGEVVEVQGFDALVDLRVGAAGLGEAAEVAFHIGHEDGHAEGAEVFGEDAEA